MAVAASSSSSLAPSFFAAFNKTDANFFSYLSDNEASYVARCGRSLREYSFFQMQERKKVREKTREILKWYGDFVRKHAEINHHMQRASAQIEYRIFNYRSRFSSESNWILAHRTSINTNIFIPFSKLTASSRSKEFYLALDFNAKKIVVLASMPAEVAREIQKTDQLVSQCRQVLTSTACILPSRSYTISAWHPFSDIFSFLEDNPDFHITHTQKLRIALDMAYAVLQMHQKKLIHGDIKPDNYLLSMSDQPRAWAIDFTTCCRVGKIVKQDEGTHQYFSPERARDFLEGKPTSMTLESDIYSLGVAFYMVFSDGTPGMFRFEKASDIVSHIISLVDPAIWEETFPDLKSFPAPLQVLMRSMLSYNPAERPNIFKVYLAYD